MAKRLRNGIGGIIMAVTKNKMSIVTAQFEKRSHWFHDKRIAE